jgi:proprotein convertase subtilisin/kexin type 5
MDHGTCVNNCNFLDGFYRDQSSPPFDYCRPCHPSCKNCSGPSLTECTECANGLFELGSICVDPCPIGKFGDTGANPHTCVDCGINCDVCTSATVCTQCKTLKYLVPHATLTDVTCHDDCSSNPATFPNTSGVHFSCTPCPAGCSACTSATVCTACEGTFNLLNDLCHPPCSAGQYQNLGTGLCAACPTGCATCTSPTVCQSCSTNFTQIGSGCFADCTSNQFMNGAGTCINCPNGCDTCTSLNNCLTCSASYFLHNG